MSFKVIVMRANNATKWERKWYVILIRLNARCTEPVTIRRWENFESKFAAKEFARVLKAEVKEGKY